MSMDLMNQGHMVNWGFLLLTLSIGEYSVQFMSSAAVLYRGGGHRTTVPPPKSPNHDTRPLLLYNLLSLNIFYSNPGFLNGSFSEFFFDAVY